MVGASQTRVTLTKVTSHRFQLVVSVRLKVIENTIRFSPIYQLIPRLLTLDPLVLLDHLISDLPSKSISNQQSLDHLERVVYNGLS